MSTKPVGPRLVYDPAGALPAPATVHTAPIPSSPGVLPSGIRGPLRMGVRNLIGYYRDPLSWKVLAITSVVLCYLGGLVLFWFHSVELGEGGPQIAWYAHWLLDSTFGFIALTPALVLILPLSTWMAQSLAGSARMVPWLHAAVGGVLFALVTTPGPIAHDHLVGRGTYIAARVTDLIGDPTAPLTPVTDYPPVVTMSQQLGAAMPLYLVLMGLTVLAVRSLVARRRTG